MPKYFKTLTMLTVNEVIHLSEDFRRDEERREALELAGKTLEEVYTERFANGPDPKQVAFREKIESLTDDEKDELIALMLIGRAGGGETSEDWDDLVAESSENNKTGKGIYIYSKAYLATYLRDGLTKLSR